MRRIKSSLTVNFSNSVCSVLCAEQVTMEFQWTISREDAQHRERKAQQMTLFSSRLDFQAELSIVAACISITVIPPESYSEFFIVSACGNDDANRLEMNCLLTWELIRSARMQVSQVTYLARMNRNEITFRFQRRSCDCEIDWSRGDFSLWQEMPIFNPLYPLLSLSLSHYRAIFSSWQSGELNEVPREAVLSLPKILIHLQNECPHSHRRHYSRKHAGMYGRIWIYLNTLRHVVSLCQSAWVNRRDQSRPDHLEILLFIERITQSSQSLLFLLDSMHSYLSTTLTPASESKRPFFSVPES